MTYDAQYIEDTLYINVCILGWKRDHCYYLSLRLSFLNKNENKNKINNYEEWVREEIALK